MLWSTPGAAGHTVSSGTVDAMAFWEKGEHEVTVNSPPGMDLTGHAEVVITLLAFNQFHYTGELVDGYKGYDATQPDICRHGMNQAESDPADSGNVMLSMMSARIITRSDWNPPSLPSTASPRLYGEDSVWVAESLEPFYAAPCEFDSPTSPGFGWKPGVPDFKTIFESATLGYGTCMASGSYSVQPATYTEHRWWQTTYGDPDWTGSFSSGHKRSYALNMMHLSRRLSACHAAHPPPEGDSVCQFSALQTAELRQFIVDKELHMFDFDVDQNLPARIAAIQAELDGALADIPGIRSAESPATVTGYSPSPTQANPKILVTLPGVGANDLTYEEKQELADALVAVLLADSTAKLDALDQLSVTYKTDSGNLVAMVVHGVWNWEQSSDGCCGYDLASKVVMRCPPLHHPPA